MAVLRHLSVTHGIDQCGSRTRYKGQGQATGAVSLHSADEYHVLIEVGANLPNKGYGSKWMEKIDKRKKVVVRVLGKRKGEQTVGEANL